MNHNFVLKAAEICLIIYFFCGQTETFVWRNSTTAIVILNNKILGVPKNNKHEKNALT